MPTKSKFPKKKCPDCGSFHTQRMGSYMTRKKGRMRRWHCEECGRLFVRPLSGDGVGDERQ